MAERLPLWVGSDHLTILGALAMLGTGVAFWMAAAHPWALIAATVAPGGQLVRRQPRRHARARSPAGAAALRLLCRPCARRRRHPVPICGARRRRLHDAHRRGGIPHRLLPAQYRDRAGHAYRRHVSHLVLEDGSDRDADPPGRWRPAAAALERRRPLWATAICSSTWVAWLPLPRSPLRSSPRQSRTRGCSTAASPCRRRRTCMPASIPTR